MILALYRLLAILASPVVPLFLKRRSKAGKEDAARITERLGRTSQVRPDGHVIWLHAASVGEAVSSFALIRKIHREFSDVTILLTTGTVTSARLVADKAIDGVIHQFCPVDSPIFVRRFLSHWRPDAAVWIESEIWPNLIHLTHQTGIPMALVNARISERSQKRWMRAQSVFKNLMARFNIILCQSQLDEQAFHSLGASHSICVGNLKFSTDVPAVDEGAMAAFSDALAGRPIWLAASTHPGEEEVVLDAHACLKDRFDDLLTILVPRHPHRGGEVSELARDRRLTVRKRTHSPMVDRDCEVYVADTLGELGLFYAVSRIAYVGGGMGKHGGHNPIEPALLGCAILYGPDQTNFVDIAHQFQEASAVLVVHDAEQLAAQVTRLLNDDGFQQQQARRAREVAESNRNVVDHVFDQLSPVLNGRIEAR